MNVFKEGWVNFKNLWTSKNYVGFKGRASRREFWTTQIYLFIFALGAALLDLIFSCVFSKGSDYYTSFSFFSTIWSIIILLPSLALLFRRIHDTGHSGWWVLSALIVDAFTAIVVIICIVFGVFSFVFRMNSYMYFAPNVGWAFLLLLCSMGGVASTAIMITNFVFTLLKGQSGTNKYGDPKSGTFYFMNESSTCEKANKTDDSVKSSAEEVKWEEVKNDEASSTNSDSTKTDSSENHSDNNA